MPMPSNPVCDTCRRAAPDVARITIAWPLLSALMARLMCFECAPAELRRLAEIVEAKQKEAVPQ